MIVRRLFLLAFAAALLAAFGCSGDDDPGFPAVPAIACSDGGAAGANTVTPTCGGATSNTTEDVVVVMGGPSAGATTLRGLSFDVTYDGAKLDFVPAGSYTSPLFPGALIAVSLANGVPGRVVVSIQQTGGSLDVSVGPGQHDVLTLTFSRAAGVTFAPTPLALDNTEATAPSTAVTFSSGLALAYQ